MAMNKRDKEALDHFMKVYRHQYKLNSYFREQYDEDLDYYTGYIDEDVYPLQFSMSFNKLLPRIMTILAKFMEHLYQSKTNDLVGVRPRTRDDVSRAPRVQGLLNYQLEMLNNIDVQGGSYLFNMQWMFSALAWGKGIAKLFWREEERIAPKRISLPVPRFDRGRFAGWEVVSRVVEAPQIVYNGPYAEVFHPKLFVPHPHYKSIQKMPACFCVYSRSIDYIKEMVDKGVYRNLKDLGVGSSLNVRAQSETSSGFDSSERYARSVEIEGILPIGDHTSDGATQMVDVIEGYGRYIFPEDETSYEVGAGYKIKGKESEAIVHIGNYKTLLRLEKNKYGMRPLFDMGCYYHPELYWDLGIIRLGKDVQEQYRNLANTRYQGAIQAINPMLKVLMEADIDPAALQWRPFGILPVEDMGDVEPMVIPDMGSNIFTEQQRFFDDTLSDILGVYPYNMGAPAPRQEYVGTVYSLQQMGEARSRLLMMTMDYQGFQPFLRYMMLLNLWHLPDNFETRISDQTGDNFVPIWPDDIHVDYDFTARYTSMEPALAKQFRAQQLLQLSNMWAQSPFLQHYQWMKAIMELHDIHDSDKYIKSPDQVAQEMAMMQQQQMQQQAMGAAMQDQLAAKEAERQLMRDSIKGLLK